MNENVKAAGDFIASYGWVMLIIAVTIVLLSYFGSLDNVERCTLPSGLACVDFSADPTGLTIMVSNGLGQDVNINSIKDKKSGCEASSVKINSGGIATINLKNCQNGNAGDTLNTELLLDYTTLETGLTHNNKGEIIVVID
ncbi:hypothetical protein ACFLZN_01100 [Nanoarchaeota archaeon]